MAAYHVEVLAGMPCVLCFGTFGLALLNLFLTLEKTGALVARGWFKTNGDASYTLYLSHPVLISLFVLSGLRDWVAAQHAGAAEIALGLLLLFAFYFSAVFHRHIEKPLYTAVKKYF